MKKLKPKMSKKTLTKVTFLLIVVMGSGTDLALGLEGSVCEPIKVDMCRQIGYNKTGKSQPIH